MDCPHLLARWCCGRPLPNPHAYGALGRGRLRNALREPRASHIFFIVRNDDVRGKVIFQTMDTTWQTCESLA